MAKILIKNANELITVKETEDSKIGILKDYSLLIEDDIIKKIDTYENLKDLVDNDTKVIDAEGKAVLPGFLDPHTHLVFGGDRLEEYVAKITAKDSDEIKKIAGEENVGIASSISKTRKAGFDGLYESSLEKLSEQIKNGITTVEIKSGYGIDRDVEITTLEVIKKLKENVPNTIVATYLGGHDYDREMGKEAYFKFMMDEVLPYVGENKLADLVDIWVEDSIYSIEEGKAYIEKAKEYGMNATIHGDELSDIGATKMAVEEEIYSIAHLNFITDEEVELLANSETVGIVLPTTDYVKDYDNRLADGRKMIDRGVTVALATNLNPGNWTVSPSIVLDMAAKRHGMTPEEGIKGFTLNAAKALRLDKEYGSLEEGKKADIQIWDTDDYRNIVYRHGVNFIDYVIKHGEIVVDPTNCK